MAQTRIVKDRFLEELEKMKIRKIMRALLEIEWWGEGISAKRWPALHNIEEDFSIAYNVSKEKYSITVDKRGKRYTHPNSLQIMKESLGIVTGKNARHPNRTAQYNIQQIVREKMKLQGNFFIRVLMTRDPRCIEDVKKEVLHQIHQDYQIEVWNYLGHKAKNQAVRDRIAARLKRIKDHALRRQKYHKTRIPVKAEWQYLAQLAEEELAFRKLCMAANRETRNEIGDKLKKIPPAKRRIAYRTQHIPYKRKARDLVYWKRMVERVRQN